MLFSTKGVEFCSGGQLITGRSSWSGQAWFESLLGLVYFYFVLIPRLWSFLQSMVLAPKPWPFGEQILWVLSKGSLVWLGQNSKLSQLYMTLEVSAQLSALQQLWSFALRVGNSALNPQPNTHRVPPGRLLGPTFCTRFFSPEPRPVSPGCFSSPKLLIFCLLQLCRLLCPILLRNGPKIWASMGLILCVFFLAEPQS